AEQLKAAGSVEDLDARRSYALEDVIAAAHDPEAGEQGAFDLTDGHGTTNDDAHDAAVAAGDPGNAGDVSGDPGTAGGSDGECGSKRARTGTAEGALARDTADADSYERAHCGAGSADGGEPARPRWSGRGVPRGKVLMYIHL